MEPAKNNLLSKDKKQMQIPYDEYASLMKKIEKVQEFRKLKGALVKDMERYTDVNTSTVDSTSQSQQAAKIVRPEQDVIPSSILANKTIEVEVTPAEQPEPKTTSKKPLKGLLSKISRKQTDHPEEPTDEPPVESDEHVAIRHAEQQPTERTVKQSRTKLEEVQVEKRVDQLIHHRPKKRVDESVKQSTSTDEQAMSKSVPDVGSIKPSSSNEPIKPKPIRIPRIDRKIEKLFNNHDSTGLLFDLFRDYFTKLNKVCGGKAPVTMMAGICSLWNDHARTEFAFIDPYKEGLRLSISPAYADLLNEFKQCEVPRLLEARRKLVGILIDEVNDTILDILGIAFEEAGSTAK